MSSIKQNGFEKSAAKKPAPKITIDLRLKPASGSLLHCFIEETNNKDDNFTKINFSVSSKTTGDPHLSSLLDAFEVRVEIRFPV
jgi:hypothetical protein